MGIQFTIGSDALPPLLAVYVAVMAVLWARGRRYSGPQYAALTAFVVYLLVVAGFVLVPIYINSQPITDNIKQALFGLSQGFITVNFIPLVNADARQFGMNIALFIPMGLLLPVLHGRLTRLRSVAWAGFLISCGIETLQFAITMVLATGRSTDIDDVIANTLGAVIGYGVYKLVSRIGFLKTVIDSARLGAG